MAEGILHLGDQLLQQLESAAQVLMSPPSLTSAEQLSSAQSVFVEFQKMKQPFELCRMILERPSSSPYVKFQAASCLKSGVIRDWSYLKMENRSVQLVSYLLEYVTSQPGLEPFVREQLLMVSAILLKRIGIEEAPNKPKARLADTQTLTDDSIIVTGIITSIVNMQSTSLPSPESVSAEDVNRALHRMFIATSFLQAVLLEYASSTRASDFGLPWIKHLEAKKRFEMTYLKQIFSSTLNALNHVVGRGSTGSQTNPFLEVITSSSSPSRFDSDRSKTLNDLLLKLLQLLETIFTWNFEIITIISTQYAVHVDSIETPVFQPSIEWRDTLINDDVVQFLFYVYRIVRETGNETLIHHALQSISQFSSLKGSIIADTKMSLKFINSLISATLPILRDQSNKRLSVNDLKACEVTPLSLVFYRICLHLQDRDTLKVLDKSISHQFIELLSSVTCNLIISCMRAETGKHVDDDFDRYRQAVENTCDGWTIILQAVGKHDQESRNSFSDDIFTSYDGLDLMSSLSRNGAISGKPKEDLIDMNLLRNCTNNIFYTYIRCHISQPEGLKEIEEDSEEIEEYEEDDQVIYFDQLNALGSLGRVDTLASVTCLSQLLSLRITQLQSFMEKMASSGKGSVRETDWAAVNEDVHWLVMICTWTLSQSSWFSDRDLIPEEVMRLSISSSADVNKTIEIVKSCEPGNLEDPSIDPVVRLIVIIFKLCRLEQYVIDNNMQLFSPQVSSTVCSFVSRFMTGFLMPNENDYKDISMTLIACFGRDSPAAVEVLEFLVSHILSKMFTWSSETSVKETSAQALVSFVSNSVERCKSLVNSNQVMNLLLLHSSNSSQLQGISVQTRKHIYHLLVLLATQKVELFDQIFAPLQDKYRSLKSVVVSQKDLNESHGAAIIEFTESLIGITSGVTPANINSVWNKFLAIFYTEELPSLLDVYHNYNCVVITLLEFVNAVTNRILCYLPVQDTVKFYETTMNIFNVYAKHNKGRCTSEAGADEESVQDIVILIQILNNLASKDFIDWFPPAAGSNELTGDNNDNTPSISASQVVFLGISVIMPLLNAQILEFQKLSLSYYKLMSYMCDETDRLIEIPASLLQSIMASVQLALKSSLPSEIKCNCLSLITTLAQRTARDEVKFAGIKVLLAPFMSTIFEFTLTECGCSKDVTLREHVASAMFSMIRCFPETFESLVQHLIASHVHQRNDPNLGHDLRRAFDNLVNEENEVGDNSACLAPRKLPLKGTRPSTYTVRAFRQRFDTFVTELIGLLRIK